MSNTKTTENKKVAAIVESVKALAKDEIFKDYTLTNIDAVQKAHDNAMYVYHTSTNKKVAEIVVKKKANTIHYLINTKAMTDERVKKCESQKDRFATDLKRKLEVREMQKDVIKQIVTLLTSDLKRYSKALEVQTTK